MRALVNADIDNFNRALELVRSLDPVGIGACNIKESLLIQLFSSGKGDSHLYRIVSSHLEDLEKGLYQKISKALSIPIGEVGGSRDTLSYLN